MRRRHTRLAVQVAVICNRNATMTLVVSLYRRAPPQVWAEKIITRPTVATAMRLRTRTRAHGRRRYHSARKGQSYSKQVVTCRAHSLLMMPRRILLATQSQGGEDGSCIGSFWLLATPCHVRRTMKEKIIA